MEIDINEPKSKAFNIYLRYLQLGLQLIVGIKISQINQINCTHLFDKIGEPISYILIGLSLLSMLYLRCSQKFPRIQFFLSLILSLILAGVVMVMAFAGIAEKNSCANNKVLHRFAAVQALLGLIISGMILCLPMNWIQRYSNSPGNIGWLFLFLGYQWNNNFHYIMIAIGFIYLCITLNSFTSNLLAAYQGTTISIKKCIVYTWVISLILMIGSEILAIVSYFRFSYTDNYNDQIALKLFQIFIAVNVIDFVFWIWGLMTLSYENGDLIRDTLMFQNNKTSEQQDNDDQSPQITFKNRQITAIGTIHH